LLGSKDEGACLELASALESTSRHPLARAFRAAFAFTLEESRNFPGEGVEARIDGLRCRIGNRGFCAQLAGASSGSVPEFGVFLASEGEWLAAFEVRDALRPGSSDVVAQLKARGMQVHLASGDDPAIAGELARELGVAVWQGAMRPEAKHDYVKALQAEGRVVAVVGDGLNDTPVLAAADVSIAMAGGADAAQLQADIVLQRLASIPACFAVARRAMRLVRENFAWALAYNALALPAAALGLIGPWEAAIGMGASSFIVMLNASRALLPKETWKASTSSSRSPSLSYS
jgi:Cu2+-exporting ATPase